MVKIFEGALSNRTEFSKFSLFPAKNPQIILMKSKEKAKHSIAQLQQFHV